MSAVATIPVAPPRRASAVDRGPEQVRYVYAAWSFGNSERSVEYRVRYRIDYPSVYHRGRGLDSSVVIRAIEIEVDGEIQAAQIDDGQRAAIVEEIEREEETNVFDGE